MKYVELSKANISQDVLDKFDCGHPDFNDFLATDAREWQWSYIYSIFGAE